MATTTTNSERAELFERHDRALRRAVTRCVRTSSANIEDACAFAWLQLVRYSPAEESVFGWLCKTAIREAIKLDRRGRRTVGLLSQGEWPVSDPRQSLEHRLELLAAGEELAAARLRPREARLVGMRAAGYSRSDMAILTGDTERTVERQLGRAQRKLEAAHGAGVGVG